MTTKARQYSLSFLGTGSGGQLAMGSSAAVLAADGQPSLLIDCGPGTVQQYFQRYQQLPDAIYLSHCHLDHIADLEILTVRARLSNQAPIRLYVPLSLITTLHQRLASYPQVGSMAEGQHNFWQSFQLIPVNEAFYHQGLQFTLYNSRHHAPQSSFSLHVPGLFFYSGDTRPIPEILHHCLSGSEVIFHDCGVLANPSHTGLDDLAREYNSNEEAACTLEQSGFACARPGQSFVLNTGTACDD